MKNNAIATFSSRASLQSSTRPLQSLTTLRKTHAETRQRRDDFWSPKVNIHKQDDILDTTQLLIRAGYLRQAYAGIFHMLPLGVRVQEKLERLIDKHMRSVGASKISLSSISSQTLWERSGRLAIGTELFKLEDRKMTKWLLAPTHEEEITNLLSTTLHNRSQLPIRLYQISRKYRDEKRPRGGLLRGREFIMKDLYTFDKSIEEAHSTYEDVRRAYRNFFDELGVSYIEARADSGNMGGKLSHEYHFPSDMGEDQVITCTDCDFARNEEFVNPTETILQELKTGDLKSLTPTSGTASVVRMDIISSDRTSLIRALAPVTSNSDLESATDQDFFNTYAIKEALSDTVELDTGVEHPAEVFDNSSETTSNGKTARKRNVYYLLDSRLSFEQGHRVIAEDHAWLERNNVVVYIVSCKNGSDNDINLLRHQSGDPCPSCKNGKLKTTKAIEVGHTFHLGTRYSSRLGLAIEPAESKADKAREREYIQMGCHGIGVSRLLAAVTSCFSDKDGLIWPKVIAPYDVVLCTDQQHTDVAHRLYDTLANGPQENLDVLLDDRQSPKALGYKIADARMVGYPIMVVLGKAVEQQKVEVHCRRLKLAEDVSIESAPQFIRELLGRL